MQSWRRWGNGVRCAHRMYRTMQMSNRISSNVVSYFKHLEAAVLQQVGRCVGGGRCAAIGGGGTDGTCFVAVVVGFAGWDLATPMPAAALRAACMRCKELEGRCSWACVAWRRPLSLLLFAHTHATPCPAVPAPPWLHTLKQAASCKPLDSDA